jgi:hypothetical protein
MTNKRMTDKELLEYEATLRDVVKWKLGDALVKLCGSPDGGGDVTISEVAAALQQRGYRQYTVSLLGELRRAAWAFPLERRRRVAHRWEPKMEAALLLALAKIVQEAREASE